VKLNNNLKQNHAKHENAAQKLNKQAWPRLGVDKL